MTVTRVSACRVKGCPAPKDPDWHRCWCGQGEIEHHHVESRGMGGSKIKRNMVALCHKHHEAVTLHDCYDIVTVFDWGKKYTYMDKKGDILHERALEAGSAAAGAEREDGLSQAMPGRSRTANPAAAPSASGEGSAAEQEPGSRLVPTRPDSAAPPSVFTGTGLRLQANLTREQWLGVGETLSQMDKALAWWVGDWFIYGEQNYNEDYSQGFALFEHKDYAKVTNVIRVASAFSFARRRANLSFSHHAELAAMPEVEQEQWLDRAAEEHMSHKRLRITIREALPIPVISVPVGQFATIVVDPPWPYGSRAEDETHRARNPYPDLPLDDMARLEIPAADDCILWLWTTNAFMHDAYHILEAWGFEPKTILTWGKDRMGLGDWLRGQTEHCILAVKGSPKVTLTNQTTLLCGPMREHSRKPDEFYALVEVLCPEPRLEMFARQTRDGWESHGNEIDKF